MGLLQKAKRWLNTILNRQVTEVFGVKVIDDSEMATFVKKCLDVYAGRPEWEENNIITINFAKSICSETARLTTMGIEVTISGSSRADWLNKEINKTMGTLRNRVEFGLAQGTMILKPNGQGVDFVPFDQFRITKAVDGEITGAVFVFSEREDDGDRWFTRFEYHHFLDNGKYKIENKVYSGERKWDVINAAQLADSPWDYLQDEVEIEGVEHPLFAVFVTPAANNVDMESSYGMPIFADALQELRDLDIAYSRNANEIEDSQKIVLLDSDRLVPTGRPVTMNGEFFKIQRERMELPHYVKNVYGDGAQTFYQEINPTLNTAVRLSGIDALLSQIGFKVGFSNGYFVFDQKTGVVTATQIDADQQRTIQFIQDIRKNLQTCMERLIYALDKFADLYELAPVGEYETGFKFGDITYNEEEDKARWYSYVVAGKVPFWYFLVKFEGMTEEDAKELEQQAQPPEAVFGAEE